MKVGEYGIKLFFTIKDENDDPVPLDKGTVTLYMRVGDGPSKEFDCFVEDEDNGVVSYTLDEGDIDEPGIVYMELEVTFDGQCFVTEDKITEEIKTRVKSE